MVDTAACSHGLAPESCPIGHVIGRVGPCPQEGQHEWSDIGGGLLYCDKCGAQNRPRSGREDGR